MARTWVLLRSDSALRAAAGFSAWQHFGVIAWAYAPILAGNGTSIRTAPFMAMRSGGFTSGSSLSRHRAFPATRNGYVTLSSNIPSTTRRPAPHPKSGPDPIAPPPPEPVNLLSGRFDAWPPSFPVWQVRRVGAVSYLRARALFNFSMSAPVLSSALRWVVPAPSRRLIPKPVLRTQYAAHRDTYQEIRPNPESTSG